MLNLQKWARGKPCQFQIEEVCDNQNTVWCHGNKQRFNKGRSIKAHDYFGAVGCQKCHFWYDEGSAGSDAKEWAFIRAFERTVAYLWESGAIKLKC